MSDAPADQITDFEHLTCRHVGGHAFRVLNRSRGTVSKVNVHDMTCNCEDMAYNQTGERDACKHLQYALYQAPETRISVSEELVHDLSSLVVDLSDAADRAHDAAHQYDSGLIGQRAAEADEVAENGSGQSVDDPVEAFESLLRDGGFDPDEFDVFVDDQYGSLQVEVTGYLEDDQFSEWVDFSNGIDLQYDGDSERNYLPPDRFGEVLG